MVSPRSEYFDVDQLYEQVLNTCTFNDYDGDKLDKLYDTKSLSLFLKSIAERPRLMETMIM